MHSNRLPPDPRPGPEPIPGRPIGFDSPDLADRPLPSLLSDLVRGQLRRTLDPSGPASRPSSSGSCPAEDRSRGWIRDRLGDSLGRQARRPSRPVAPSRPAAIDPGRPFEAIGVAGERIERDLRLVRDCGVPPGDSFYECERLLRVHALAGGLREAPVSEDADRGAQLGRAIARIRAAGYGARLEGALIFRALHRGREGRPIRGADPLALLPGDLVGDPASAPGDRGAGAADALRPSRGFPPALAADLRLVRSAGLGRSATLRAETILLRQATRDGYAYPTAAEDPRLREQLRRDIESLGRRDDFRDCRVIPAFFAVVLLRRYRDGRYAPGRDLGRMTDPDRARWAAYWPPRGPYG